MKLQVEAQQSPIADEARARIALVLPVFKGILFALQRGRVERLGGHARITLADLGREYREGDGDCGICFEYAVHEALNREDRNIYPIVSDVLETFCRIKGGAKSILFGAEKSGAISLVETPEKLLTEESRVLSGKIGQPAKLKRRWNTIKKAFRNSEARLWLPNSISGIWKADLFIGSEEKGRWVGTTLKLNRRDFEGAPGLRVAIYPESRAGEGPMKDEATNLILCPLPYNHSFMELFYSSFFIVKQFLAADARVPAPVALPGAADRFVAEQLAQRRDFSVLDVIEHMSPLGQPGLTIRREVGQGDENTPVDAVAPVPSTVRN